MSPIRHGELGSRCGVRFDALSGRTQARVAVLEASFEAVLRAQDAPRVSSANNRRLAMTMLANPNRLNSCASFLAKPL